MPKLRLDLFSSADDLVPQPRYLDRIILGARPLVIVAIENEDLDTTGYLNSIDDVRDDMLQALRATSRSDDEVEQLPHSILIDDFRTILRPEDPGVALFLAALEGDPTRMEMAWEAMQEEGRASYAGLAAEALALAPGFFGYSDRIEWLNPMLKHIDLDQLADRVMPNAAREIKAKQNALRMKEVISFQMNSSDTEIVPRRRKERA